MTIPFEEPIKGVQKTYTHEIFFVIDKYGKILKLRLSFDENNLFVRSAYVLKLTTDFEGDACYKHVAIKNIHLCDTSQSEVMTYGENPSTS